MPSAPCPTDGIKYSEGKYSVILSFQPRRIKAAAATIKGKCSLCEYKIVYGGCRARAYESTGDYLEAEPYCIYNPVVLRNNR
jgi:radical SAM protein with 4Fe4S-binding SPASM domain